MTRHGRISQLPYELLVEIFKYVVPTSDRQLTSAEQSEFNANIRCLRRVSRLFRTLTEPPAYHTFFLNEEPKAYRYNNHDDSMPDTRPVPVPGMRLLAENYHIARHIRSLSFDALDLRLGDGIKHTVQSSSFQEYVRQTYSPRFCLFLDDLIASIITSGDSAGKNRDHGVGFEMMAIFTLTLAHSVQTLTFWIGGAFDDSPLGKFFSFCGGQRREADEGVARRRLRAPLSSLRALDVGDYWGYNIAQDKTTTSLLLYPGLESCILRWGLWTALPTTTQSSLGGERDPPKHAGNHVGGQYECAAMVRPCLKRLELLCIKLPHPGGSAALARILRTYPMLETLILELETHNPTYHDPGIGDDEHEDIHPQSLLYAGFADALQRYGRHLRRFDLGTNPDGPSVYHEREGCVPTGSLRCEKNTTLQLECLKIPLIALVGHVELSSMGGGSPNLSTLLPGSLRYLWCHFPSQPLDGDSLEVYATAFVNMLVEGTLVVSKMARVEWVMAEMASADEQSPCAPLGVPPGWMEARVGDMHYLYRRVATRATARAIVNVLRRGEHPDCWDNDVSRIRSGES